MSLAQDAASARLRLVIVDADHRVRESLASLIGSDGRIDVVGRAGHVGSALEVVDEEDPDVVVVDPRLPDVGEGLALLAELRALHPGLTLLAMGWSDALEGDAIASGADAFLAKTGAPNELIDSLLAAADRPGRVSAAPRRGDDGPVG